MFALPTLGCVGKSGDLASRIAPSILVGQMSSARYAALVGIRRLQIAARRSAWAFMADMPSDSMYAPTTTTHHPRIRWE